ncbi:MAG: UvrD-helicase domain-containing protein [Deltaproteobacteria bacterium]|nr:UvrD-helicase domain-containing protein [Deltaproteobacteria bacterium]
MTAEPPRAAPYAFPRNLVLAASAGTGKTHALVGVVVSLLVGDRAPRKGGKHAPIDPSRVVATTFSRKAAAEIRARVTQALERIANDPSTSPYLDTLRVAGAGGRVLADDDLKVRARRALARLPSARFGTLHSFATGIVRAHAVELGLGPGFELAADADSRARADDAVARALEERIATHPRELRALAEAAGGVDRLVVQLRRTLAQLEEDGRPARDLSLPSGDVEAIEAQMQELVAHARALTSVPKYEAAARDFLAAMSRDDADAIERAATALTSLPVQGKKTPELESYAVFRKAMPGATNEEKGRRFARAYLLRHRFAEHARIVRDVLASAEAAIERGARVSATIGFGEILRAARELLRDRPDVASAVGQGIDALLVDEFQDTSRVQRDLLQLLWAKDEAREAGLVPPLAAVRESGLLVVGDRKQSIYGFRGADVGVFAELAVGLAGAPARVALGIPAGVTWEPRSPLADFVALRHNRRSDAAVLAFANAFSARRFVPGDPPPALFEIDYVPETEDLLVPPEREEAARDLAEQPPVVTWLRVQPRSRASSSRLEEALVIADRVAALRAEAKAEYRDIAVLATTNGMLDAAAFALAQREIPYVVAGKSFYKTREVRDLAAMLSLVLEPGDRLAALEVLRGPWVSAHDETLLGLTRTGEGLVPPHLWSEPPHPDLVHAEDRPALIATASLVAELSRCAGRLGPGAILREAVRARALDHVLARLPRGEQRVANVRKLLAIADRHVDPRAFSRWLDDASEQELAESEAATFSEDDDAVRLLTVHASKGLDFPIVFVPEIAAPLPRVDRGAARIALGPGDEPNLLAVRVADDVGFVVEPPSFARVHASARRRERAERQRLAYVAITRAAHAMYFVGGRSKEGGGDPGAASIATLEEIASDPKLCREAKLLVEDVTVPAPAPRAAHDQPSTAAREPPSPSPAPSQRRPIPAWRQLPIAPTALADFDHCARRFELVHLLGLPERARGVRAKEAEEPARASRAAASLDARAQGTLAHAVLERVPVSAFAGKDAEAAASAALAAEGVPADHPTHAAIVARVVRFLSGDYARTASMGARILREVPFVLPIGEGGDDDRAVVLRGSMDLVVAWEDGSIDVVDYKSARAPGAGGAGDAYAFQLDVYALAARAMAPSARRLRAGLVYLGGTAGAEPVWRALPEEGDVRARLAAMGSRLVLARWTGAFPRVELARCEAIYCGFIGRCHPSTSTGGGPASPNGTDAKPSRATTT